MSYTLWAETIDPFDEFFKLNSVRAKNQLFWWLGYEQNETPCTNIIC